MLIKKSEFNKLYEIACQSWKTKFDEKFKKFLFSDNLEIEESFLLEMQKALSNENQTKVFNTIFKNLLPKIIILNDLKDYSSVCKRLKISVLTERDFSFLPKKQRKKALASHKIQNLEEVFNGGWVPNFDDENENKYYPYFRKTKGVWVFFGSSCYLYRFDGCVGLYRTKEISDHVGTHFKDIYIDLLD